MSDFKIATKAQGVAGFKTLDALTTPLPDPQFYYQAGTKMLELGDGSYKWVGAPKAKWRFPQLTLAQRNQIDDYCTAASAEVYIATPDNTATFKNYLVVMRLPEEEPANKAGLIRDYEILFDQMEVQA